MESEELRLVRRSFEAWNSLDADELKPLYSEDCVFHSAVTNLVGKTVEGHDAIVALLEEWAETWESIRWECDEMIEAGDGRVVTLHRVLSTGRESGIAVERELGGLFEIRDGLITDERIFLDRSEALRAVGLGDR